MLDIHDFINKQSAKVQTGVSSNCQVELGRLKGENTPEYNIKRDARPACGVALLILST